MAFSRRALLFATSVAFNAAVLSFIAALVLGTFFLQGESAQGAGLTWVYSLPAVLVLGLVTVAVFPWFT